MKKPTKNAICIIGGGGHALVVFEAAIAAGLKVAGFFDDNPTCPLKEHAAFLGDIEAAEKRGEMPAIIAVGDLGTRKKLISAMDGAFAGLRHPGAWGQPDERDRRGHVCRRGGGRSGANRYRRPLHY